MGRFTLYITQITPLGSGDLEVSLSTKPTSSNLK